MQIAGVIVNTKFSPELIRFIPLPVFMETFYRLQLSVCCRNRAGG